MTPGQYRREGAEAMRKAAAEACADYPRIAPDELEWTHYDEQIAHSQACIRAIDVDEVLAKLDIVPAALAVMERLQVVARCGTDSTMRHSAYAFMAHDPEGDYVAFADARAEIARLTAERDQALAQVAAAAGDLRKALQDIIADRPSEKHNGNRNDLIAWKMWRRARAALAAQKEAQG